MQRVQGVRRRLFNLKDGGGAVVLRMLITLRQVLKSERREMDNPGVMIARVRVLVLHLAGDRLLRLIIISFTVTSHFRTIPVRRRLRPVGLRYRL